MFKPSVRFPIVGSCPEHELLLCCARTNIDSEKAMRIECLLQEDIDWDYLITAARRNKIIPLLYRSLHATYPEAVPRATLAQLQEDFETMSRRNLYLAEELLKLLHSLDTAGIPAIPYKGPVLAVYVYGDLNLRYFWDLDILVHPRDVERTKELLITQEFEFRPNPELSWQANFVRAEGKVEVDLHWSFTPLTTSFPVDLEELWGRLEPMTLAGSTIHTLPLQDLLLIHCQDAVHDYYNYYWPKLKWICDTAELIHAYPNLDWEQAIEQAEELKTRGVLLLCLSLARDLLGATLPEKIERKIQADPQVKSLAKIVGGRLFGEGERRAHDPQLGLLRKHFFSLRLKERLPLPEVVSFPLLYTVGFFYYLLRSIWRNEPIRVD